jgi:hypothetical protein
MEFLCEGMQDDHSFTLFDRGHLRIHCPEVTDLESFRTQGHGRSITKYTPLVIGIPGFLLTLYM